MPENYPIRARVISATRTSHTINSFTAGMLEKPVKLSTWAALITWDGCSYVTGCRIQGRITRENKAFIESP